jgi:hypothetical protein
MHLMVLVPMHQQAFTCSAQSVLRFTCRLDHICEAGEDADNVGVVHCGQHRHLGRDLQRLRDPQRRQPAGRKRALSVASQVAGAGRICAIVSTHSICGLQLEDPRRTPQLFDGPQGTAPTSNSVFRAGMTCGREAGGDAFETAGAARARHDSARLQPGVGPWQLYG